MIPLEAGRSGRRSPLLTILGHFHYWIHLTRKLKVHLKGILSIFVPLSFPILVIGLAHRGAHDLVIRKFEFEICTDFFFQELVTIDREVEATKREWGAGGEVLPLRKGWAEKVSAMLKGGHNKFWGSFYPVA